MITAETITADQLRELKRWAERVVDDAGYALLGERPIVSDTLRAGVAAARARCAEILLGKTEHDGAKRCDCSKCCAKFPAREAKP